MSKMIDHMERIADKFRESLPRERIRFEETPYTSVLSTLRLLAVADYMKTKNPEDFRKPAREIIEYVIRRYQRQTWLILPQSSLGIDSKDYIFTSLASGDWSLTNKLLMYMKEYIYAKSNDLGTWHEFFRVFILGEPLNKERLDWWIDFTAKKFKSYSGYPLAFQAITDKNISALEDAFKIIMKGHKQLCKPSGYFLLEDNFIAIWPLAILNLARFKGLFFEVNNSYIPEELLVTPEEVKASLEAWEKEKKTFKVQPPTEDLLKEEEFYEMLVEKKIPKEYFDDLFSLYRYSNPSEASRARSSFVGIFNNDREFKKFKKYVPVLPKYLIERIIELILAKSTYHQKQCDELKALMK